MKKKIISELYIFLVILLFLYTSTSKFLDYDKFVFQMRLAPVPLIIPLSSILGWLVPVLEIAIATSLAMGFFYPYIKIMGLYALVILLTAFEIYITIMLLSGSQLPCTCGGIISQMGWKPHLSFNAFFILTGILSIKYEQNVFHRERAISTSNDHKILSRA